MAGTAAEWELYERWNSAIVDVVYPRRSSPTPVYLDLDDEVLAALRDEAEPHAVDPERALIEAVKGTLVFRDGPATLFRGHLNRLDRWLDGEPTAPPPTLGLLALLSLAAERMHVGDGKAAHNFYGRLAELLDLDKNQIDWFTHGYHKKVEGLAVSQRLWSSLNDWLEALEGNRGLPTAFPVGHAHIGLPLSQALVREADRVKFGDMFASYGLPPHSTYPSQEMENLIAEWMSRTPCPASSTLEGLWKRDADARERIVEVARATLEAWDGAVSSSAVVGSKTLLLDVVRAKATLRTFPRKMVDISLVVPARVDADNETVELLDFANEPVASVDLVPASSGWMTLADPASVDISSFLNGVTCIRRQGQAGSLRRRSRRLVPLRWDDMLQGFVEAERVLLGEDSMLIVRDDIVAPVRETLSAIARPGFAEHADLMGVPDGWTVFEGVQILSSVPADLLNGKLADLNLLQPLATTEVVLQGGMRLPGNVAKWSSGLPPELRASTDSGGHLWSELTCVRPLVTPSPEPRRKQSGEPVLIWDLAAEHLPDGDYEVVVGEEDGEPISKAQLLRLRSADHPAVRVDPDQPSIGHSLTSPLFGIAAGREEDGGSFQCVPDPVAGAVDPLAAPPGVPAWYVGRQASSSASAPPVRIVIPTGDEKSCMTTGFHYTVLEQALPGMKTVEGVCRYCGLVKRLPAFYRAGGRKKAATKAQLAPRVDVHGLEGEGTMSWLERIAMQIDPTGLFVDAFARRLEAMGHIEIERDPSTLRERSWAVVDPHILELPTGEHLIAGFRSERLMAAIEDAVWRAGGEITIDSDVDSPAVVRIVGVGDADVKDLAAVAEEASLRPVRIVRSAAWSVASRLPPLSGLLPGLPVTTTIGARSFEVWNPGVAKFEPTSSAASPGAFRLTSFIRTYIYRRPTDLGEMQALLGDARLVKFAAALDAGIGMVGYDTDARVLYVPLGADLPGLYARAAVLASGYAPKENTAERLLEYRNVPPDLASHLAALLMS
ncbi:MAG: hypothetical protein HYX32_01935 [Actinobacteria bacterium]|nr:hypothetical protein [Actinomycetota bacterium]